MLCVSGKYDPAIGPLTKVDILRDIDDESVGVASGLNALIDSGASHTSISRDVADSLGLMPVNRIARRTPAGIGSALAYEFWIRLVAPGGNVLVFIGGTEYDSSGAEHDILLGRDVICLGDFHMLRDGIFELVFPEDAGKIGGGVFPSSPPGGGD